MPVESVDFDPRPYWPFVFFSNFFSRAPCRAFFCDLDYILALSACYTEVIVYHLLQLFRRKRAGRPPVPLVLGILYVLFSAIMQDVAQLGVPAPDNVIRLRNRDHAGGRVLVVSLCPEYQKVGVPQDIVVRSRQFQK